MLETDLFSRKHEGVISRSRRGRDLLEQRVELPSDLANALARRLKRRPEELSRRDVLRYQSDDLARETGMPVDEIQRLKLTALGLRVRRRDTEDDGGGRGGR